MFDLFHTPTEGNKVFDSTFWTDGFGVSLLKRTLGTKVGAERKRKRGMERKDRDIQSFLHITTLLQQQLN